MGRRVRREILLPIVLVCLLLAIFVIPIEAQNAMTGETQYQNQDNCAGSSNYLPTVYISPEISTTTHSDTFKVDVNVRFIYRLSGFRIFLSFDPTLLKVSQVVEGSFLSNHSMYETSLFVIKDNALGLLKVWGAQIAGSEDTAVAGNGTLFSVTFTVDGTGQSVLHLHNVSLGGIIPILPNLEDGFFDNKVHKVTWKDFTYIVVTESNSTVIGFYFDPCGPYDVLFNVSGEEGTVGYVNVTLPKALIDVDPAEPPHDWLVFINWEWTSPFIDTANQTHTFIYLTHAHTENSQEVIILILGNIPEFPSLIILPLLMLATFLVKLVYRRKKEKSDTVILP